ncbi:phosphate/phosphite/phosphonate ABC transporter substrate-binding protein [Candidatus Venteria ishoeyi]|uniref:ABC transporter, phosphonate, periplasmic substrate-binding protein n=1 Tax=Candidatus Venteria ishoeyi TaxID=1899563 RepID=A0A1H6FGR3_9GAMM|nr:phosphate/phosphite/phosphonate ABC transporter substrate-binding protein [Candidatus Venteria ishoeyi]MDM8545571.1 phosphate/phosphite/phosphonate ABC transporter substrate-binding protein [Candidatus Venteria ishoeyi]SEH08853.1 ABC transporter%2C phosphonate%2C periplasmic substrate-binding protein [Candidatus Venteria ishoeyi]
MRFRLLLCLLFCALALNVQAAQDVLVIGKVSSNPKKHYRYLKPMADYAVSKMGDLGIKRAKVLMARNNKQMIGYLRSGKVDWVTETIFNALIFQKKAKAQFILRKWKKGVPEYHTVFFTRKDSGINTLAQLKGKVIAFEDPGSSTAFFLPAMALLQTNLELLELGSPREQAPKDRVGYVFSRQEINTSTWVHKGLVNAGAYNNLDWEKEDHNPGLFRKDMQIIYQTKPYPRAIELVRKDLDAVIVQRLKEVLLNAHNDPDASAALRAYQKTTKFDELTPDILMKLDNARNVLQQVQDSLN